MDRKRTGLFYTTRQLITRWVLPLSITLILGACSFIAQSNDTPSPLPASTRNTPQIFSTAAWPTPLPAGDVWLELLEESPYPYTTPLPERTPTELDSIYAKVVPTKGTPVPCRRCPDYLMEGGLWKLSLEKGAYHIYHEGTKWKSLGSYAISGDRLYLFNDPACFEETGIYRWTAVEGGIKLELVEDTCQVERRGRNFADMAWQSCHPPSTEAAVTDHWPRPVGCED